MWPLLDLLRDGRVQPQFVWSAGECADGVEERPISLGRELGFDDFEKFAPLALTDPRT